MIIKPYNPKEHKLEIANILIRRNINAIWANSLPEFGLVAIEQHKVVACGFIRKIEGGAGLLDGYLTDQSAPPKVRNKALDIITKKLLKIAKEHNTLLMCLTENQDIINRAKEHGFYARPFKFLAQ